eukprot:TRINITY_DN8137_c0_g1_i1.p1 TRINITY_DN8137_c0_g1~~TRINITY_DN8137_c0_g1_i1.p1  ORF type:complete len:686 (-),score=212.58 TRINITY_DN8137_c0_g1_i1:195-2252(-)
MKFNTMAALLAFLCIAAIASTANATKIRMAAGERPTTAVVKQLQAMADKSEADGQEEKEIFAKFKCYCDKTLTNTSKTMELLKEEIASTENRIEALNALTKELNKKKLRTEKDIQENLEARAEATKVREKAFQTFLEEQADLVASLAQLNQALTTLTAPVALNQLSNSPGLLEVVGALDKARSNNLRSSSSLLQVPTKQESQTGGVAGVLRSTRDTYESNLEELRAKEDTQLKAFNGFIKTKTDEWTELTALLTQTNAGVADAGTELGERKGQLVAANDNLAKTTTLNIETDKHCKEKTAINEERAMLRAQEDSAIAKAIAVLNSDEAFETFGKTKATGNFLQLKSVHQHSVEDQRRPQVLTLIAEASHKLHSARLAGIAALVSTGNPFEKVLKEIESMVGRIAEEGDQDKRQFETCADERSRNNAAKTEKEESIIALTASIDELEKSIDEMNTDLDTRTEELANNDNDQKSQTEQRTNENKMYQQNIAVLQQAQGLIAKATKILSDYYESIAFVQTGTSAEGPPKTNDGKFEGQSSSGSAVISLLKDIMTNSKAEEKAAHEAEQKGQIEFEDSMKALTDEEASLKAAIAALNGDLAQAKLDRDSKKGSLSITETEKANIEGYLASIKSDCDFIALNFELREGNRAAEKKALDDAVDAIKGTPAYKKAANQAVLDAKAASYSGHV